MKHMKRDVSCAEGLLMLVLILMPSVCIQRDLPAVNPDSNEPTPLVESLYPENLTDQNILLFSDEFNLTPLGYDDEIWSVADASASWIRWDSDETLCLDASAHTETIMRSRLSADPCVLVIPPDRPCAVPACGLIAQFRMSFSGGLCYFGIGWSNVRDGYGTMGLRCSSSGVFIDYWDGQLYLVTCSVGIYSVTPVPSFRVDQMHSYRIVWTANLAYLEVDGVAVCSLSTTLPVTSTPFVLTAAGLYDCAGADILRIDRVGVYTHGVPQFTSGPEVVLVWPQNCSAIRTNDKVSVEILGGDIWLSYCWDDGASRWTTEPREIPVPSEPGLHSLDVSVLDYYGEEVHRRYWFDVVAPPDWIRGSTFYSNPEIDGVVESWESDNDSENTILFFMQDRTLTKGQLVIRFLESSIYLGVRTPIRDGLSSCVKLQLDLNGDGRFGGAHTGEREDIVVIAPSPSALAVQGGVSDVHGNPVSMDTVHIATASQNDLVMAEFLVPLDITVALGSRMMIFAIEIIQGGYGGLFPVPGAGFCIVEYQYQEAQSTLANILVDAAACSGLIGVVVVSVVYFTRRKARSRTLAEVDEPLERLRILIDSYPEISVRALREMSGVQNDEFDNAFRRLVEMHLADFAESKRSETIRRMVKNQSE